MEVKSSKLLVCALQIFIILAMLVVISAPAQVRAAGELTVTPITWNVIGLDSNNTSVGPNNFPVGVRVCNNTASTITNIIPAFNWGTDTTSNTNASFIYLRPGSYGTSIPYPQIASLAAGACTDVYFEVEINRSQVGGLHAYNTSRRYIISVSGTYNSSTVTASSPSPREIFVERLISQNRNSVNGLELDSGSGFVPIPAGGTMSLMVGNTYKIKLIGATATQGYEQIESFINFPNVIFKVNSVTTTYSANAGTDNTVPYQAATKLYADGCKWVNDPNSPVYRSCVSTGKYGGNIAVTFNVTILSGAGTSQTLTSLIYDFSGSSYHYNADLTTSARIANIIASTDPNAVTIAKSFVPSTITTGGTSQLNITIHNPNASSVSGVAVSDNLPSGMTVNSPLVSSLTGCGAGTLSGTSGSTISFSGGTIAANSSCVIRVNVSATTSQINTTQHLFVDAIDTNKTASASLTVAATTGSCVNGVTIARWSVPGILVPPDNGAGVPSTLYSGVTALATGNGLNTPSVQTLAISPFASANWWNAKGFNVASPGSTTDSFVFTLTSLAKTFSSVTLSFNAGRGKDGATGFTIYASTAPTTSLASGTIPQINGNSAQSYTFNLTGTFPSGTSFFIAPYGAPNNGANSDFFLDEVTFTGDICSTPPPTLSKSFASDPIRVNTTSVLTFTIANTQPANVPLSGVGFTDVLPVGLTVGTGSVTGTCSAGSSGTISTTSPRTINLAGGIIATGGNCVFAVTVTGAAAGDYENISTYISSTQTGTSTNGVNVGFAYDTLSVVSPPTIFKSFGTTSLFTNEGFTTLSFTISNPNPAASLSGINFIDTLPPGLEVTSPNGLSGTCDNDLVTAAGSTISISGATLAAGSSCTFSVNVTGTSAGAKNNSVTVAATGPLAVTGNTSTASLLIRDRVPALEVNKQISLSPSGPWSKYVSVTLPASVYYRFTIYNTGDVAISNIAVMDSVSSVIECSLDGPIAVSDSATCDSGEVTAISGVHNNTVKATANAGAVTSSNTSSASYATTGLSIEKTAKETDYSAENDVLHYGYLVTNTGSAPLFGPVTISDDKSTDENCPALNTVGDEDDWLDAGESITCSATYTVTADDVSARSITNTASATVEDVTSNPDQLTLELSQGTLIVTKIVINDNSGSLTPVDFSFSVNGGASEAFEADGTNNLTVDSGNYTITESSVTGYSPSFDNCSDVLIPSGGSATCTITNDDIGPSLTLRKTVTNDNGGTLTQDDFTPSIGTSVVEWDTEYTLSAGSYNVSESTNAGYAAGEWGGNCAADGSITLSLGDVKECTITNDDVAPTLTLEKTVVNLNAGALEADDFQAYITDGIPVNSPVDWGVATTLPMAGTYIASETQQTGYIASLWGDDCSADGSITLSIGQNATCTITNTDHQPSIDIVKEGTLNIAVVSPTNLVNAGDQIEYDLTVTNTGNIPLTDITVTDPSCDATPAYESGDLDTDTVLGLTETWAFSCTHTLTQAEIEVGTFSNTAQVTGTSPVNGDVDDEDTYDQDFVLSDEISVEKTSTTTSVTAADQVINYSITVINGGNTTLSGITVTDPKCDAAPVYQSGDDNSDNLFQVTEEWVYTCSYTVSQADIDAGTDVSNTVYADSGETDPAAEDTLDIPVTQNPAISLTKSGSLDATVVLPGTLTNPGDTITYTFSVENTGNVTLVEDITVTDPMLPGLTCVIAISDPAQFPSGFVPGASASCTPENNVYTLTSDDILSGSVENTAIAATIYSDVPVTDVDQENTDTLPVKEITLEKTANSNTFKAAGDVITYTYIITNSGNQDLYPTYTVVDDKVSVVNCPILPNPLTPGDSVTCIGDYTVTTEDITTGSVVNFATAFVNTISGCQSGCVLAQAEGQATINRIDILPDDNAKDPIIILPATGFAPNSITVLTGKPETLQNTGLTISIPALNLETSITGVPNSLGTYSIDWLWKEVGWLEGTAYPGRIGNSVLTAHVYLPNGRPGPFVDLKTLQYGQRIIVQQAGKSYIYEVRSVRRVTPEDLSSVSHKNHGYLTLITCQGYDLQTESYLFRTVVQAVMVDIKN